MIFSIFSEHIKLLRTTHGLTSKQMAKFIGLGGSGSLSTIENAKNPPSFKTMWSVATLFAVDLEWLIGRVSYPYRREIIIQEEKNLFPLHITIDGEKKEYFPLKGSSFIPDEYTDLAIREQTYSLPLRADILYVAHVMQFLVKENPGVANLPYQTDTPPDIDRYMLCQAQLYDLLINRIQDREHPGQKLPLDKQVPLFDILKDE